MLKTFPNKNGLITVRIELQTLLQAYRYKYRDHDTSTYMALATTGCPHLSEDHRNNTPYRISMLTYGTLKISYLYKDHIHMRPMLNKTMNSWSI